LRRRKRWHPLREYVIHPAAKEPDADSPFWRFNCSGFVLHAYHDAGIQLVAQEDVPLVTLAFLKAAYPESAARKRLDDPEFRTKMGIGVGDHWRVIMPGYIVNSLDRSAEQIRQTPYRPSRGDEFFPPQDRTAEGEASSQPTQ